MLYTRLRAFHMVAQEGGFSRAAEAMGLTQPALSDQVRKLEQEFDLLLFNRQRKRLTLTEAGRRLFELTLPLFEQEARAQEFLTESREKMAGTLRVMADSASHVTEVLSRFRARHPGVKIVLTSGNSRDVVAALEDWRADIGVLDSQAEAGELMRVPLGWSPIVAFARRDFPALPHPPVPLARLAGLPLILREGPSRTRQKVEEAARAAGVTLVPAIEAEGREAVRELVASGAGIGFVARAEFGHDARLRMIPLAGPPIRMEETVVCLARRAGLRKIRAFMALAAEQAGMDGKKL